MKKSGLHKQITSIFNDVPETRPTDGDLKTVQGSGTSLKSWQKDPAPETAATPKIEPQPSSPQAAVPAQTKGTRPMPIPTNEIAAAVRPVAPTVKERFTKAFGGGSSNPRQKKTAIFAGVLVVMFAVVLFISLGGVGSSSKTSKKETAAKETSVSDSKGTKTAAWKKPEPLGEKMRDPMKPAKLSVEAADAAAAPSGELLVKGIVFSQNKPSALINNEIVGVGEVLNGISIVRIDKSEVEFECNGKRWTQPVQR